MKLKIQGPYYRKDYMRGKVPQNTLELIQETTEPNPTYVLSPSTKLPKEFIINASEEYILIKNLTGIIFLGIYNCKNLIIENCEIFQIEIRFSTNLTLRKGKIDKLTLIECTDNVIESNMLKHGISIINCRNNTFRNNICRKYFKNYSYLSRENLLENNNFPVKYEEDAHRARMEQTEKKITIELPFGIEVVDKKGEGTRNKPVIVDQINPEISTISFVNDDRFMKVENIEIDAIEIANARYKEADSILAQIVNIIYCQNVKLRNAEIDSLQMWNSQHIEIYDSKIDSATIFGEKIDNVVFHNCVINSLSERNLDKLTFHETEVKQKTAQVKDIIRTHKTPIMIALFVIYITFSMILSLALNDPIYFAFFQILYASIISSLALQYVFRKNQK